MAECFSERLIEKVHEKKSHVVVGIDPHFDLIDASLRGGVDLGQSEEATAIIKDFCSAILETISDLVVAAKFQVAFFERLGSFGFRALEELVSFARSLDLLVISDSKRADIGTTAAAYADYHLGTQQNGISLNADAMTVNPYLGRDSMEPFIKHLDNGKGIFVLVKTSNPGSRDLQELMVQGGSDSQRLYEVVADISQTMGQGSFGSCNYSSVGMVVGATFPEIGRHLRQKYPNTYFLLPGFGTQGATSGDIVGMFNRDGLGSIVNASRSILFAHRRPEYRSRHGATWRTAARQAAGDMRDEINESLKSAGCLAW